MTTMAACTSVIVPAYNEELAIGALVTELRAAAVWHQLLVVDDASSDQTATAATSAGARVLVHPYNKGNGASVKTGLRAATGEFILIVDGDGQHRPADALRLLENLSSFDLVVGARRPATQSSWLRRFGNAVLNAVAGYVASRHIPDLTSGLRAAHRDRMLEFIHLIPNRYSTPTTTTMAFIKAGYGVTFVPVEARQRRGVSKIHLWSDGVKFLLILLRVATIFSPLRIFLPFICVTFATGSLYALWTITTQMHVTNSSVLLLLSSVLMLVIGLVSEQIASLRADRPSAVRPADRER